VRRIDGIRTRSLHGEVKAMDRPEALPARPGCAF
jgi:hypothetical protein